MKYMCAIDRLSLNYHIRDEVPENEKSSYGEILPMPDRPKSGQFWYQKQRGE